MNTFVSLIAVMALLIISFALSFANYWYVFGIWPKSWFLFVVFAIAQLVITMLMTAIGKAAR